MFTIKWNGDYSQYRVTFADGWNRLNSCNAAFFEKSYYDNSEHNALGHKIKYERYYLVSYASPILCIKRIVDETEKRVLTIRLIVNDNLWNCSRTTISHIGKYLNNLHFFNDLDINYYDVKEGMTNDSKLVSGTSRLYHVRDKIYLSRESDDFMRATFNHECPSVW